MTGDYPVSGFKGRPKRHLIWIRCSNGTCFSHESGLEVNEAGKKVFHQPGTFFAGSVVSPFKAATAELMGQYQKLRKKISQGAGFIITQLGFDAVNFMRYCSLLKALTMICRSSATFTSCPMGQRG
jgi:methylenetetrahydrofolate reductase (NADPH)